MNRISWIIPVIVFILFSCNTSSETKLPEATEVLHKNEKNLTELIIYDIFSPPVAARIYTYTSLAAHEAIRHQNAAEASIVSKLNDFPQMPDPQKDKKYNYVLAASVAFYSTMREMTFSKDTILKFENETYEPFKGALDETTFDNSFEF